MLSLLLVISISLLSTITVHGLSLSKVQARATGIQWSSCPEKLNSFDPYNRTFQCGSLEVPLDYTDKSSTTKLNLELIKVPALQEPKLGSILMNFGGPGGDGLVNLASGSPFMQPMTGGRHDLISWNPRGTGNTLTYKCYANDTEQLLSTLPRHNEMANASDVSLGRTFADSAILAASCAQEMNATGSLVGTAFAVRDMFQIVDALDEGGKLNYWGISYGTVLGATALAMFPDRINRAIIDGVQNPHDYYHSFGDSEMFSDTDEVWREFLSGCMNMTENCALAKHASSAADLEEKLDRLFEDLKSNPFPVGTFVVDYSIVKGAVVNMLYYPNQYADLASTIELILTKNVTALASFVSKLTSSDSEGIGLANPGIKCSDKFLRTSNISDLQAELTNNLYKTSTRFGDFPTVPMTACAQWPFEAKERYNGDFHANTSYPVLIIGNTWDPVTPLISARNISESLPGSVVLQHNGHGHVSISQRSNCTSGYIAGYFINGTLPSPGTKCEPNAPLFAPRS